MSSRDLKLACFSPPVMIATFFIEVCLALFTLWRYRGLRIIWVIIPALLSLATFQLSEWMVCEGALGLSSYQWAQIGYVGITLLPPLGVHIGMELQGKYNRALLALAYTSALGFIVYFLSATGGVDVAQCLGNYVIFRVAPNVTYIFGTYYYLWLLVGIALALWSARSEPNAHTVSALRGLCVGYASFLVPVAVAYLVDPATIRAIPSIMCGFAVIFAVVLVQWVLPQYVLAQAKPTEK